MSDEQRNDGLHPRHPGRGKCGLIELEGDKVEHGGALIFLPSGRTKVISWSSPNRPRPKPAKDPNITPQGPVPQRLSTP